MNKFRGTGRTTKMIGKAKLAQLNGYDVMIIMSSFQKNIRWLPILDYNMNNKFILVKSDSSNINWDFFTARGASKNTKVFFDHFAIEKKFPEIADDYNFLMSVIDD